jgi:hypothetical protein
MRSPRIDRINEFGQAVAPWLAAATCFALLASAAHEEKWLLLIFASISTFCAGSALILIVRSCWREVLGWLLDRVKKSTLGSKGSQAQDRDP